MKKSHVLAATVLALGLGAGAAHAEPKSGLGVNAGLVASRMNDPLAGSYQSSGLSLGLDYQFALSDSLSINPFLMTSREPASGNAIAAGTTAAHGMFGLEMRYWIGSAFVGGHLFTQSEVLSITNGNVTTSTNANGGGLGLVGGWEDPHSGLYVMGQLDGGRVHYPASTTKVSELRLSIGYRWK
jgi:hypothetical protein